MTLPSPIARRAVLGGGLALLTVGASAPPAGTDALAALERRARGRLGVHVRDLATGRAFGWRADERFAQCSSFKLSLAAMVLAGADRGRIDLAERLHWRAADVLPNSPATAPAVATGLTVRALAHAALVLSDNTAANVLLRRFGGPAALTRFWRRLGDRTSRLDRYEPELNVVPHGTALDTTTPAAATATLAALHRGPALAPPTRALLAAWMTETKTGATRLRAGFPAGWIARDKTGTGPHTIVDLAFGGPQGRAPIIVAAYFEPADGREPADRAEVLAEVGRIAAAS